jgi:ferredoxin
MLRQINAEELAEAIQTVKRDIALPAVLGRICPKPCEKGCRRRGADGPVAICQLKRYAADVDLAGDDPYLPDCAPASGRRVAVVGGGPTGLAAAYYLRRKGHQVALFDNRPELGGRLWDESTEEELPRDVLRAEIAQIVRTGVEVHSNTALGEKLPLESLRQQFHAVLIACGAVEKQTAQGWGLEATARGIVVEKQSYQTAIPAVFAAGNAIRTKGMVVRSVADGKEAAESIDRFLARKPVEGVARRFSSRMGKLTGEEMVEFIAGRDGVARREPLAADGGFSLAESIEQSGRCLHCDCRALGSCRLKYYSDLYGADPNRFQGERARFEQDLRHSRVIYEPGKCINCGLCIDIATAAGEPLGLTFVGRGFDVRVGVPFDESLEKALGKVAAQVVEACPTAALAFKSDKSAKELPILGQ